MSTEPLEQAISVCRGVLAGVDAEQLHEPTPCASWDVSELINHIVGGQHFFAGSMKGDPPSDESHDFASGDYLAEFDEASATALEAFGEQGALEKMVTLPFGTFPGIAFMGLATTDTFTHAWDLARATGQDTNLAPELAAVLLEQSRQSISEDFRGPEGAPFGAETQAAPDAPVADQLAAFLGRTT